MAKAKKEFNTASEAELAKLLSAKREELRIFRFGVSGSKVKNMKEGAAIKKDIARIMTELSLRQNKARVS